ncbi:MAG: glutamate--tRNA ligase family protein, partial [Ignavibacteriota bacterium]
MINETPRVRFAPSPTGYLHVGGLRTALYNYLFAKHNNGSFVLRIEDTDRNRFVEGAVENLINALKWVGLNFDEGPENGGNFGPYMQSERLDIYKKYCDELVNKGAAYYAFDTPEDLDEMRKLQQL